MKKKFKREYLTEELDLPRSGGTTFAGCTVVSNDITGQRRWSTEHDIIFRFDDQPEGEAWLASYEVGSTECQDQGPWEYEEDVEAVLVRQVDKVVKAWVDADKATPQRGTILGGPVEMRDYDFITLAVEHRAEYPDIGTALLPAGTRLHMVKSEKGALGLTYENGAACKAGDWPHPDSDESKARMADLVAQAKGAT